MSDRVVFRGSRRDAARIIRDVGRSLTGEDSKHSDLVAGVYTSVGIVALGDIHADFQRKAKGHRGEDGTKWKPLSPQYLAYGRRAPKAGGYAPGGKDGMLTASQLKRWRGIFASRLARFALSMPLGEAKAKAAAIAWAELKRAGAKTKLAEYQNRPHEIGRDTGVLLNSLSPGANDGILEPIRGGVIVGTTVAYGAAFNAKRPFIPEKIPESWAASWIRTARQAVTVAFRLSLER